MKKKPTKKQILELEKQAICPSNEFGIKVAKNMNISNKKMILNSFKLLDIQDENLVLELGHGSCGHLTEVLKLAKNIKYYGLEISELMKKEAKKCNTNHNVKFKLYNGEVIPFSSHFFDRILSVNTVYFWSNPQKLINEIERVLKPNGYCVLTYANKKYMKQLSFARDKFKLFDKTEIEKLVKLSNMEIVAYKSKKESITSKTSDERFRVYTMVKIKKIEV